jgi:sugar phosphate isomerase/epimerase
MNKITRNRFLKLSGLSAAAITLDPTLPFGKAKSKISIGLCGYLEKSALAKESGCEYIEAGTAKVLMPLKSDEEFNKTFGSVSSEPLKVRCFNVFIPGELKSVGENAQHEKIIEYASVAFKRAEKIGADIIVFGSSGSRTIPDGFDRASAKEQFVSLCKALAPIASTHKIVIAIEALNKGETNFINFLHESAEVVETVKHPNLKMICDIYHALKENDPPSELVRFKDHLVHCHIAEKEKRTPPGVMGDDFTSYFKALKQINYQGRISLECNWTNFESELPVAVKKIHEQFEKA